MTLSLVLADATLKGRLHKARRDWPFTLNIRTEVKSRSAYVTGALVDLDLRPPTKAGG